MHPTIAAGHEPRFNELDPETFEALCCDLFEEEKDIWRCRKYGSRGQADFGIDLFASRENDQEIEIGQCKRYASYSVANLKDACNLILKENWDHWHGKKVKRFIIFVGCDITDPKLIEEIQAQRPRFRLVGIEFDLWDAAVIRKKLAPHPRIVRTYLTPPDFWLYELCGVTQHHVPIQLESAVPGPFATTSSESSEGAQIRNQLIWEEFLELKESARKGNVPATLERLEEFESDSNIWNALTAGEKARILVYRAGLTLDLDADVERARHLHERALSICDSVPDSRLKAVFAMHEGDSETAISILEESSDIDSVNALLSYYVETHDLERAEGVLARFDVANR